MVFPIIIAVVVILGLVAIPTVPVAIDTFAGDSIQPGNALYGIERTGEGIKLAAGLESYSSIAVERAKEYKYAEANNLPDAANLLVESDTNMVTAEKKNEVVAKNLDERNEILESIMVSNTITNETKTYLAKVIEEDYGAADDLRSPLASLLSYLPAAQTYCAAKGGEWHWDKDFIGCVSTKSILSSEIDCSRKEVQFALQKCKEAKGTAVCDEFNAYCKR